MTVAGITVGQITLSGALLLLIVLIARVMIRGDWMPRKTVQTLLEARDSEIARAIQRGNEWHEAYEAQRNRAELLLDQNAALIEVAQTVENVMHSLQAVVGGDKP